MKKLVAILMALVLCVALATASADSLTHFALNVNWGTPTATTTDLGTFGTAPTDTYTVNGVTVMVMEVDIVNAMIVSGYASESDAVMLRDNSMASTFLALMTTDESYVNVSEVMTLANGIAYQTFDLVGFYPSVLAYDNGYVLLIAAVSTNYTYADLYNVISVK